MYKLNVGCYAALVNVLLKTDAHLFSQIHTKHCPNIAQCIANECFLGSIKEGVIILTYKASSRLPAT